MKHKKIISLFLVACMTGLSISPTYAATDRVNNLLNTWDNALQKLEKKEYYEVGDIKLTYNSTNPGDIYGGTWKQIGSGRVLIGAGNTYASGTTGGSKTVTLTTNNIPSHNHSGSTNSGGSHSHSISTTTSYPWNGNYFIRTTETARGFARSASGAQVAEIYPSIGNAGSHTHTFSTSIVGGDSAHNNLQPYVTCYFWQKTANASKTTNTIPNGTTQQKITNLETRLSKLTSSSSSKYSVGDIVYMDTDNNPTYVYGGTWVRTAQGRVLVGVNTDDSDFQKTMLLGGEKTHTLTTSEMPSHYHTGTVSSAGSHNHGYSYNGTNGYGVSVFNTSNDLLIKNPGENLPGDWVTRGKNVKINSGGSHTHSLTTSSVGSGQAHSNLMPYYSVYMWRKISDDNFSRYGYAQFSDDEFKNGTNSISRYGANGAVVKQGISSTTPYGNYAIRVETTGTSSPGAGGFVQPNSSATTNKDYYYIIIAKIPKGYTINPAANSYLGGSAFWLTSNQGTGGWYTYILKIHTGNDNSLYTTADGSWSHQQGGGWDFGFFYLNGSNNTSVKWYIAYCNMYTY